MSLSVQVLRLDFWISGVKAGKTGKRILAVMVNLKLKASVISAEVSGMVVILLKEMMVVVLLNIIAVVV